MPDKSESDFERLHRLVTDQLDTEGTQNHDALAAWLTDNPAAQREYLNYVRETVDLRWTLQETECGVGPFDLLCDCQLSSPDEEDARMRRVVAPANSLSAAVLRSLAYTALPAVAALLLLWFLPSLAGDPQATPTAGQLASSEQRTSSEIEATTLVPPPTQAADFVATFQRAVDVDWGDNSFRPEVLERLVIGQELIVTKGKIELVFDTDVEVVVRAPSRFRITSANSLFSWQGAFSATVGETGKGFSIETPTTQVLDLGTEFGVVVGPYGETDVAVFSGEVNLAYGEFGNSQKDRLIQGEGLRVKNGGEVERLVSFDSSEFPIAGRSRGGFEHRLPLIAGVHDNILRGESKKYYKIIRSGLHEDSLAFVDRSHEWNGMDGRGLPHELLGGEYIMPFNDDKFMNNLEVQIDIARPAVIYLLVSDSVRLPEWLLSGFKDTGLDVGLDEGASRFKKKVETGVGPGDSIDTRFSVWSRAVSRPQTISLGEVKPGPDRRVGHNMYGIVAVPLDSI